MRRADPSGESPMPSEGGDDDTSSPRGSLDSGVPSNDGQTHPTEDEWCAVDPEGGSTSHEYYDCDIASTVGHRNEGDDTYTARRQEPEVERDNSDARSMLPPFPTNPSQEMLPDIQVTRIPSRPVSPTNSVIHQRNVPDPDLRPTSPDGPLNSPVSPASSEVFTTHTDMSARRRTFDPRGSRLSGFFSNLLHINRDAQATLSSPSSPSPMSHPYDPASHTSLITPATSTSAYQTVSPTPLPRPTTPPPSLPPPTLQELGLGLNIVTFSNVTSQAATHPISGTFLQPHFLLLCHSQGLDVLPLASPPTRTPYALVRRVPFKTVVVMEERGVMVAIAGRRDGVRVYALEEVRRAVEWRIEVEVQREKEKARKEESKRSSSTLTSSADLKGKAKAKAGNVFEVTLLPSPSSPVTQPVPIPPTPQNPSKTTTPTTPPPAYSSISPNNNHTQPPRPIPSATTPTIPPSRLITRSSTTNLSLMRPPVTIVPRIKRRKDGDENNDEKARDWTEADDDSDEEALVAAEASGSAALDERTSAVNQQQMAQSQSTPLPVGTVGPAGAGHRSVSAPIMGNPRRRPSNLDLARAPSRHLSPRPSATHPESSAPPSPAPTILSLRAALTQTPPSPTSSGDERNIPRNEVITLAQALRESRLPHRPIPASLTSYSQTVVTGDEGMSDTNRDRDRRSGTRSVPRTPTETSASRKRRRWSILDVLFNGPNTDTASRAQSPPPIPALPSMPTPGRMSLQGPPSSPHTPRSYNPHGPSSPTSNRLSRYSSHPNPPVPRSPSRTQNNQGQTPNRPGSRFISKILTAVRNSGELPPSDTVPPPAAARIRNNINVGSGYVSGNDSEVERDRGFNVPLAAPGPLHLAPPPKLEYVKLPGTKGALMIKAVETQKKSFLAILCGDAGEKVELFAGTYRTALGLSRTFILPDSPRSLELQLQGDDLVELFLVFGQNVFGLEPATVRVREVRIGRAERRAARRRANNRDGSAGGNGQGTQMGESTSLSPVDETTVITTVVSVGDDAVEGRGFEGRPLSPIARHARRRSIQVQGQIISSSYSGPSSPISPDGEEHSAASHNPIMTISSRANPAQPAAPVPTETENEAEIAARNAQAAEELAALAAAQSGPYSTFQQLSFAPSFPLAIIADDYIIPPTYPSFLEYKQQYEPESLPNLAETPTPAPEEPVVETLAFRPQSPISPPPNSPSPPPPSSPPALSPKWFYIDPKGIVRGPWKSSLMQTWLREGYLPANLPVRRDTDDDYILLKDLRAQSGDPNFPFQLKFPPLPLAVEHPAPAPQRASTPVPAPAPTPAPNHPRPTLSTLSTQPERPTDSHVLLTPLSLLAQPKHFGPPALFFSSRGGHSTTIVDNRGRSVLKGRFVWSPDDPNADLGHFNPAGRMGDVRRLEAFNTGGRAVIVALRQGGIEAVDVGDALLAPADNSRNALPTFTVTMGDVNRRSNFVYRIGGPIGQSPPTTLASSRRFSKKPNAPKKPTYGTKGDLYPNIGNSADINIPHEEELIFLGRNEDEVYFCERNAGTFRILQLSPLRES